VAAVGLALDVGFDADADAVVLVALLVSLVDVVALTQLHRSVLVRPSTLRKWLLVDLAVLVVLNLWSAHAVPGSLANPFHDVLWNQIQGAVVMWFALYGVWGASAVFLAGVPLVLAMVEINGRVPDGEVLPVVFTQLMWLGLAVVATMVVKAVLDTRTMAALREGVEAGQELQRLRHLREVHDTVLQTLEGIALCAAASQLDERQRLATVAEAARAEALRLRENIRRVDQDVQGSLELQLAECVDGFRQRGLDVELESVPLRDRQPLPQTVCRALRDATFEALTNVVKHAQAQHVRVTIVHDGDEVEVVVEDDGRGYDAYGTVQGFGITQSICGRLAEVGGSGLILTRPGEGTRVVLRVDRPRLA
jgi:signal transduction histidine kinase